VTVPVRSEKTERTKAMASTDKQLEEQLFEAGKKLADPPSSVEELLSLLEVTPFPLKCCFN